MTTAGATPTSAGASLTTEPLLFPHGEVLPARRFATPMAAR